MRSGIDDDDDNDNSEAYFQMFYNLQPRRELSSTHARAWSMRGRVQIARNDEHLTSRHLAV